MINIILTSCIYIQSEANNNKPNTKLYSRDCYTTQHYTNQLLSLSKELNNAFEEKERFDENSQISETQSDCLDCYIED